MRNSTVKVILDSKPGKIIGRTVLGAAAWLLSGCQTNTIYFATNTQFGIRVGVDSKQIPEVAIGYNRQEGVMLPLKENNGSKGTNSSTNMCNSPGVLKNGQFIGQQTGAGMTDAYSVIAIFTGNAGGSATVTTTNPSAAAKLGIAQYFATGVAAQSLAKAGAAVVGGPASTTNAQILYSYLTNTADSQAASILAYVTETNGTTLDTNRVQAIAPTDVVLSGTNSVQYFLTNAPPTLAAFKKNFADGGAWTPQLPEFYSKYTNIVGTTKP